MRKILSYLSCFLFMAVAFMFGQAVKAGGDEYKVIFVGDSAVGKTSIVNAILKDFQEDYCATIGAGVTRVVYTCLNGSKIILNIWDTAGQERFRAMVPMYVRDSDVAVVVCSKNAPESQKNVSGWIDLINYWEPNLTKDNIIVVSNKSDLPDDESNNVDETSFPNYHFIATSAKNGENISELLNLIANIATDSVQEEQSEGTLSLHQLNNKQAKKGCC